MSYILEALKKSDQQRQRGATPTLPAAQMVVERRPAYYGWLAVVLLGTGVAIGWLHPWQAGQPVVAPVPFPAAETVHQNSVVAKAGKTMRQNNVPAMASKVVQPNLLPARRLDVTQQPVRVEIHIASAPVVTSPRRAALIAMTDLPLQIQQEIPAITIQLHAYSEIPAKRLVSINSRLLHEGESLTPALKLEQITPEGVIFSDKGYRFFHGIR